MVIRPERLHHAAIRVSDFDRSRRFYEGLLGLRPAPRPDIGFPGAWYGVGESQIHLIQSPRLGEGIDPTDPHFAIEVEDFEAAKKILEAAAAPFIEIAGALWVKDPDGYTVELRGATAFGSSSGE